MTDKERIEALEADNAALKNAIDWFARTVETIAFEMSPPNPYTPRFVEISLAVRAVLATPSTR